MYQSEIRPSEINQLIEKVERRNYRHYLTKLTLNHCRAFNSQTVVFDFPVTALIGPNGGGKTTILGASALLYSSIQPRQFFTRNRQLDQEMKDWSITYEAVAKEVNPVEIIKRTASFSREKWSRNALSREVLFFGVSRTIPAVERSALSKYTNKNVVFQDDEITQIDEQSAKYISKILGKDVSEYTIIQPSENGTITLLSGITEDGNGYSEFHFGAGESSIIKMVMNIEKVEEQSLILIEEIENGLHPVAVIRLVEYLIDVAKRKKSQIIFTTHSENAIKPLPSCAVWAAVNGTALQGKLDIQSLRSLTGEVNSQLVVYVEDSFAKEWISAILRNSEDSDLLEQVEIYAMEGDGTAVKVNKYHNEDPSNSIKSICYIDGDSRQEQENRSVYRLFGECPETYIFDTIMDKIDVCSGTLAVRCGRAFEKADAVAEVCKNIRMTNRDPHLLFNQVGKTIGFINESVIINAFLSTWCEFYPDEANEVLSTIQSHIADD